MIEAWLRWLQGVLFLALFLFGGPGIPAVDALVYHRGELPRSELLRRHVETADARCHAERCLIGLAAVNHRLVPPTVAPVVAPTPDANRHPVDASSSLPAHEPLRLSLPRSPPLVL